MRIPKGFTLAELLVALVILGLLAMFTIPKILSTSRNNDYKYRVQVAASMISGAYVRYLADNTVTGSFVPGDLTPYMNYLSFTNNSSVLFDNHYGYTGSSVCDAGGPCVKLQNGALIRLYNGETLGQVAPNYAVIFQVDPDGTNAGSATTNGPGKMIELYLYPTNGRVVDRGSITNKTFCGTGASCAAGRAPDSSLIAPWFSWD